MFVSKREMMAAGHSSIMCVSKLLEFISFVNVLPIYYSL